MGFVFFLMQRLVCIYTSADLVHHEIFVGKGGITFCNHLSEEKRADCFNLNGCMLSCGGECVSGFIPVNLVCACSLYKISQKSKLPFSYFCLFGVKFPLP